MLVNHAETPDRRLSPLHRRMALVTRGLTLQEVADRTLHHPETVRRYMRGQLPSVRFLQQLCREFDVDANWLLLGSVKEQSQDDAEANEQSPGLILQRPPDRQRLVETRPSMSPGRARPLRTGHEERRSLAS